MFPLWLLLPSSPFVLFFPLFFWVLLSVFPAHLLHRLSPLGVFIARFSLLALSDPERFPRLFRRLGEAEKVARLQRQLSLHAPDQRPPREGAPTPQSTYFSTKGVTDDGALFS
jgi:hypothetical protein